MTPNRNDGTSVENSRRRARKAAVDCRERNSQLASRRATSSRYNDALTAREKVLPPEGAAHYDRASCGGRDAIHRARVCRIVYAGALASGNETVTAPSSDHRGEALGRRLVTGN